MVEPRDRGEVPSFALVNRVTLAFPRGGRATCRLKNESGNVGYLSAWTAPAVGRTWTCPTNATAVNRTA